MSGLESYIGDMKRVARTNGGEYEGPCPHCGGTDRFRVWPRNGETGAFWCRQCEASGDGIDYLREVEGMTFPEACRELHVEHKLDEDFDGGGRSEAPAPKQKPRRKPRPKKRPAVPHEKPPAEKWQARARRVMNAARTACGPTRARALASGSTNAASTIRRCNWRALATTPRRGSRMAPRGAWTATR